jgi:ectoine hydroxylase-related dioxygenase (phytanoyl-CoA dioxygenase family)
MNMKNKLEELKINGYTKFDSFFDLDFCDLINKSIDSSYEYCRKIQIQNGVDQITDGTLHHLIATNDEIYLEILEKITISSNYQFIKDYFNGNFILNSYGGVKNLKSKPSYVSNIHRDIRFFSGNLPLMLNLLIMLDDFTLENGATFLLAESHLKEEKPSEDHFYANSHRAVGKKGDILFFDSNLWHAAGVNNTDTERRAITITFSKPFMKQQLDYSRAIGYDFIESKSEEIKQILGFFSRVPSNLNEWYQLPNNRFYKNNQD